MVGFDKQLFVRKDLPKDLFCAICLQVLKEPINCKNCELFFCLSCTEKACSHSHKCKHEYMEANKYIKNKIDELVIRCIYSKFGCQFTSKVCDIEDHQKGCELRSNNKDNEEILAEETKEIFKNTFKPCPISQIDCELGCKKEFQYLQREKQETIDWLNGIIANFEKSQLGLREENLALKKELENQKEFQEKALSALNFELKSKLSQQEAILKQTEEKKIMYEKILKQLEEESAYKMKIFHENSLKRVDFYIEKTKEDYDLFSKHFAEHVQNYFDNVKQNVDVFNVQIENKTEAILPNQKEKVQVKEKERENGVKEEVKQKSTPVKKVAAALF